MESTPSQERWQVIMELSLRAIDMPASEREQFLRDSCGEDRQLRSEIETLIRSYEKDPDFLETPVAPQVDFDVAGGSRSIGSFRLIKPIGAGGMGTVFLAKRSVGSGQQTVALKVVHEGPLNPRFSQRFETEQRVLANLSHPNIASLIDAGKDEENRLYIAMEYVDGVSITRYCDKNRLGVVDRLVLFRQVATAVHFAHQNLIVHRDLKPSNILVSPDGRVKLLDFGIAKILGVKSLSEPELTQTKFAAMTPAYASPEQIRRTTITTASDVYSLGVLLYELVAGHLPYDLMGKSPTEVENIVSDFNPPPPSTQVTRLSENSKTVHVANSRATTSARLASQLRGELDNIILKALRKEPARRYRSVSDLDADIGRYLAGLPIEAQPDSVAYRTKKFISRNRTMVAATGLLALLLTLFSVVTAVQSSKVKEQSRRATIERDRAEGEADRAESTVQSLIEMFATANPSVVPGADTLGVLSFLELAQQRVVSELGDKPLDQSRVRNVMGEVYLSLGDYERAASLFAGAHTQMNRISAADEAELAMIQRNWARSFIALGKPDTARVMLGVAEKTLREYRGEAQKRLALVLVDLATTFKLEELDLKIATLSEARSIVERVDSADLRLRGIITNNIALTFFDNGDFEAAAPMFEEAIQFLRSKLSDDHPEMLEAQYNYAASLDHNGEKELAEAVWRDVIDRRIKLYGENDRELMGAYSFLGANLWLQGKRTEAIEMRRAAYQLATRLLGRNHPRWAANSASYGVFISQVGEQEEALDAVNGSINLRRRLFGAESVEFAISLWARGMVRYHGADFRGAEADISDSMNILERHAANGSTSYVSETKFWLGRTYLRLDKPQVAYDLLKEAREYRRMNQSQNEMLVRNADIWLGVAASDIGDHVQAVDLIGPHYDVHMDWPPLLNPARQIISEAYRISSEESARIDIVDNEG